MAKRGVVLRGDRELRNNLRKLSRLYTGNKVDQDIEYAVDPLVLTTERNARRLRDFPGKYIGFPDPATPPKGGHLDEGVAARRVAASKSSRTWWVAFRRRARKLAHLVEFGTAPHFQRRFRGGFSHPGARPHPFFRPAFEGTKHDVLNRLKRRVQASLHQAAARLRH